MNRIAPTLAAVASLSVTPAESDLSAATLPAFSTALTSLRAPEIDLEDGELAGPFGGAKGQKEGDPKLGRLFFINGFDTEDDKAVRQATRTGDKLGVPTWLVFNDLTMPVVDHISLIIEKLGDSDVSVNEATATIEKEIAARIEAGAEVHLIGFSAGAVCTMNALNNLAGRYERKPAKERKALLGRIHVLTVGSGCFDEEHPLTDGWPVGLGSIFHLYDKADPINQFAGPGEWDLGNVDSTRHSYLDNYLPHIEASMLLKSGKKELNNGK